jgi:hypothetical protein
MRTSRLHLRSAALIAAAATMMFACSGDGESPLSSLELPESSQPAAEEPPAEEPAPEEPPAEEPAPEQPPAEEPAPEQPPAEEADGEPLTTEEWVLLILIGLLVVAVIAGLVAAMSRRSPDEANDGGSNQRALDDITRSCRSIHDSSVIAVLQAGDPTALQATWGPARSQLVSLEGRISYLVANLSDPAAQRTVSELGSAVAGVRGALDSNVALRIGADTPGQAGLVEASNKTALNRAEQLELALQQALYLRL